MNDDPTFERVEMVLQPDGSLVLREVTEIAGGDIRNLPQFDEFAGQFFAVAPAWDWGSFVAGVLTGATALIVVALFSNLRAFNALRNDLGRGPTP